MLLFDQASQPELAEPVVAQRSPTFPRRGGAARIGILFHDFSSGGSERIMIRLANGWAAAGRQVEIVCGSEAGPARSLVSREVTVRELAPAVPRSLGSRLRLGRAMRAHLSQAKWDVLVAPGNFHMLALWAMGAAPMPVVCKLSNPLGGGGLTGHAERLAARLACARLDAVVAMSPALAADAAAVLRLDEVPVLPQPNVQDVQTLPSPRAPRAPAHLLAAGRLVRQKRFDLALDVLARVPDGSRLTIAGEGPERARLERQASRLGVGHRVRFAGHVPDLAPLMADADLFLLTSDFEGFPGVVVEAIAAGIPVVSTPASPALGELLGDASLGAIVDRSADALARAVNARIVAETAPNPAAREAVLRPLRSAAAAAQWLTFLDGVVARHEAARDT